MQLGTQHMFERTQVPIDIPDPISPRVQNQSYPGNVGDTIVRKWKEIRTTRTLEGIKREHIPAVVGIIKDEMNVQEGADRFSKSLEEMFKECTTFYTKTTVLGDLNDDTMIFAMFHAVETADDKDKINVSYVKHPLHRPAQKEHQDEHRICVGLQQSGPHQGDDQTPHQRVRSRTQAYDQVFMAHYRNFQEKCRSLDILRCLT